LPCFWAWLWLRIMIRTRWTGIKTQGKKMEIETTAHLMTMETETTAHPIKKETETTAHPIRTETEKVLLQLQILEKPIGIPSSE